MSASSSSATLLGAIITSKEEWENQLGILFQQELAPYIGPSTSNLQSIHIPTTVQSATIPPHPLLQPPSPLPPGESQPNHRPISSSNKVTLTCSTLDVERILHSNELEHLDTGRGPAESPHMISDSTGGLEQFEELRRNLTNMWINGLNSDVQITLTVKDSSGVDASTTIFTGHRYILVSRAPYFRDLLSESYASIDQPVQLKLPTPPFTPASLHFVLGFIYTGTMEFHLSAYDFGTIFDVIRSAKHLGLGTLEDEARARIVAEMMHGLFHSYLAFDEYEHIIQGKWGTGGCKCDQCQQRAPRVLEFALDGGIRDNVLERGAGRALASMYGEGWTTTEFLALPPKVKKSILKDVKYRTVPCNIIPLLQATQGGLKKLTSTADPQAGEVKELMLLERKKIDDVLCSNLDDFLGQPEWLDLLESDAAKSSDMEKFDLVLESIRRGLTDDNAGRIYQNLVSSVLLRVDPATRRPVLSNNSTLKVKIEQLRIDVIGWMKKRWSTVRTSGCFRGLEPWALKDISADLGVFVQEISTPGGPPGSTTRRGPRTSFSTPKQDTSAQMASIYSFRTHWFHQDSNPGHNRQSRWGPGTSSRSAHSIASRQSNQILPGPPTRAIDLDPSQTQSRLPASSSTRENHPTKPNIQDMSPPNERQRVAILDESSKTAPGPDESERKTARDATISRQMTANEVISQLVARGCRDLTEDIDHTTFSEHPISHGGFSDIFRGCLLDKTQVAVKALRTLITNDKHLKARTVPHAARELYTWGKCSHPNVLQLHGLAVFRGRIGMVAPWMERGTLPQYLRQTPGADRHNFCVQICEGLAYLHKIGIIHGDLKGGNVLVSDNGVPVLADFGNSLHLNRSMKFTETTSTTSWTMGWAAPEILTESDPPSEASDVYALGMTIYEILGGALPYDGLKPYAIMKLVVIQREHPARPKGIPAGTEDGDKVWDLLLRCWSFEPKARPSANEVAYIMRTANPGGLPFVHLCT